MHKYLRSIGFSKITNDDLSEILYRTSKVPDYLEMAMDTEGNEFSEIRVEVNDNLGLAFRGKYNNNDDFIMDYYFPYYEAMQNSCKSPVQIIKESDRECYQGVCEDDYIAMDVIFHMQNMIPFMQSKMSEMEVVDGALVSLCGLSVEGKVILPIYTNEKIKKKDQKARLRRRKLIAKAKDGDADAYEKLTIDDMDTYSMISKRINNEDVLSIVNSTFMPSGIENDKYEVIGEIISVKKLVNNITDENVFIITLDCNGLTFDICINEKDLLGEPKKGRRFKGIIWMQGKLNM